MRLVVNDYSGHPFQVELSRELAARGHVVLHVFSSDFQTPRGDLLRGATDPDSFDVAGVSIGAPFEKYHFIKRRGQEIAYAKQAIAAIAAFRPDVLVGCNNPLDAQAAIQAHCRANQIPFVFWLQDIYSAAIMSILSAKLPVAGTLVGLWYQRLEKRLLSQSDHVVSIAEAFRPQLAAWQIRDAAISVIENWAPIDKIKPMPRDNAWSRAQGLNDKRVVLYTGTIGLKHNPDLLLKAAMRMRHDPSVQFVVTSEGRYADYVAETARSQNLQNMTVLPFQDFERYGEVLATGDILLAMIEPDAAAFSVPSKVLSYLCAGRPIVLAAEPGNLAAQIVGLSGAGYVVPPRDAEGFANCIETFLGDTNLQSAAGDAARKYAVEHFDIRMIADRFEAIFQSVLAQRRTKSMHAA